MRAAEGGRNLLLMYLPASGAMVKKGEIVARIDTQAMRDHLERLLDHTRLKVVQWINLNRHVVEFTTLSKRGSDRIMAGQNHKSDVVGDQFCTARKAKFSADLI